MLQVQCHPVDFNKILLLDVSLKDFKQNLIFVACFIGAQKVAAIPEAESLRS
jgi:hypothetical protein